jgi:hypothetical protein
MESLFWARLWEDSGAGVAFMGSVDISVCASLRADSYFSFPRPDPLAG